MKDKLLSKMIKNTGIVITLAGGFIALIKGFDRADVLLGLQGVLMWVIIGLLLVFSGLTLNIRDGKKAVEKDDENKGHWIEYTLKKKKMRKIATVVISVSAVVYAVTVIWNVATAPVKIQRLMESEQYERAFDALIKSNISESRKEDFKEKLIPLMKTEYTKPLSGKDVLVVDGIAFYVKNDSLYMKSETGEDVLMYTAGSYDLGAKGRFDKDFIYSGDEVVFIEHLKGYEGSYKNVVAVNIKTKNHHIVDYQSECYYFDKLTDGRILLSDNPTLVYNPFNGKLSEKELKEEERTYIYGTMG